MRWLAYGIAALLPLTLNGQWTGGGGTDTSWANDDNWDGTAPGAIGTTDNTASVTFPDSITNTTVTVDEGRNVQSITFSGNTGTEYTLEGGTLHLTSGGTITLGGNQRQTFDNDLVFEGASTTTDGSYTFFDNQSSFLRFFGDMSAGDTTGTVTLNFTGTNNARYWVPGNFSDGDAAGGLAMVFDHGLFSVTSTGSVGSGGRVYFNSTSDNTHSGGMTMNSGEYWNWSAGSFGTGTITWNNGLLRLFADGTIGDANNITNDLILNGTLASFQGRASIWEGNITLGANARVAFGQQVRFMGDIGEDQPGRTLIISSNGTSNDTAGMILGGDNTFTGGVILRGTATSLNTRVTLGTDTALGTGTLVIEAIGSGDGVTIQNRPNVEGDPDYGRIRTIANAVELNTHLRFLRFSLSPLLDYTFTGPVTIGTVSGVNPKMSLNNANAKFTGVISTDPNHNRPLTLSRDAGVGQFTFAGNNALTATLTIDEITLNIGDGGASGQIGTAPVVLANEGSLNFNRTENYLIESAISGTGTVTIGGGGDASLTESVSHSGATNVTGNSILRVDGTTGFDGGLSIAAGSSLGGSGLIDDSALDVVIVAGAGMAPGSFGSAGTLTLDVNSLDLSEAFGNGTGNFIFRLGTVSDLISVNSVVALGEAEIDFADFNFIAEAGFGQGTYTLIEGFMAGGSINDGTGFINGLESELFLDGTSLTLTVIPEPGTVAAILGALALGFVGWRRSRREPV